MERTMKEPSYNDLANSYELWEEYVDPSGFTSEVEFEAMTVGERVAFIVKCFGPEPLPEPEP